MRLYNPKLKNYSEFREFTYHETVTVRNGFCEVENPYSIAELKRRGFLEVAKTEEVVSPSSVASAQKEPATKRPVKKEPLKEEKVKKDVSSKRGRSKKLSRSSGIVEIE